VAGNPKIQIDIIADGSDARKEVDKTAGAFEGFKKGLDKSADWAGGAGAALVGFGAIAVDAAKDAELAATSVDRAFGTAAGKVHAFADQAATTVGVSTAEYESLAATFGTAVQGMGLSAEEAATKTDGLLIAAGDLALAVGTDVPTAAAALGGALRGEFDSLGEFGVAVDSATVLAGLAAKGITDPATGLAPAIGSAQYQQELLNQVMGLSGTTYQGYRAETDTTTESTDKMKASFEDAKAKLGEALLPMLQTGAEKLTDLATWIDNNSDAIGAWIPWIGGAALAVWALNWALAANPIVLWSTAILVAVGAAIYFRKEIGDFLYNALTNLNDLLSSSDWWDTQFQEALGALGLSAADFQTTIDNISGALSGLWGWFSRNWSFTLPSVPLAPGGTTTSSGFAVPGGGVAAGRSLRAGGPAAALSAAAPNITIQVGVGDPDAIARAVQRVLTGRARRVGAVNL
jgi:hypothetical protein